MLRVLEETQWNTLVGSKMCQDGAGILKRSPVSLAVAAEEKQMISAPIYARSKKVTISIPERLCAAPATYMFRMPKSLRVSA